MLVLTHSKGGQHGRDSGAGSGSDESERYDEMPVFRWEAAIEAEPAVAVAPLFVECAVEQLNEQVAAGEVAPGNTSKAAFDVMKAKIIADAQENSMTTAEDTAAAGVAATAALGPAGERFMHYAASIMPYAQAVQLLKQRIEAAAPAAADMTQLQEALAAWEGALSMANKEALARNHAHAMQNNGY